MKEKIAVVLDIEAPAARKALEAALSEDGDFEVLGAGEDAALLWVVEVSGETFDQDLLAIKARLDQSRDLDIFLTASEPDTDMLMRAMRAGVREFLPQPLTEEEVRAALWRFKERREKQGREVKTRQGRVINVFGAKGGVGTTTVAVNLAAGFLGQKEGATVALMDMNLPFGEVQLFLDLTPKYHWGEVLGNITRLDATYLMSVMSRHASGLYLLPPPSRLDDLQMATPENIEKLLSLMRQVFDTVVIDLGMYLDEITLKVMDISDAILLVCVQNLPCLANVRRFMDNIRHIEGGLDDKLKIVVNRHLTESELSVEDMEKALELKTFWTIPNDYKSTLSAINQGKTLSEIAPKSMVAKSLGDLAARLVPAVEPKKKKGLFGLRLLSGQKG